MTWDRGSKVLDVEGPFESRSKESAKRRDKRGESSHHQAVNLERSIRDRRRGTTEDSLEELAGGAGEFEIPPDEDRVGFACDVGEHIGSEIAGRANHVVEPHEECSPLIVSSEPHQEKERTARAKMRVQMKAPIKPSTVFFGLSLISGVRPNALPRGQRIVT